MATWQQLPSNDCRKASALILSILEPSQHKMPGTVPQATHQSELKKKKKNLNENENTTYHVQNAAKLVLRGKFTDIHKMKFPQQRRQRRHKADGKARESIVPEAKGKRCFKK